MKFECKNCLSQDIAVDLYNKGIVLYNVLSKENAFKYKKKHYASKNIKRLNQHTFKKNLWKLSFLSQEKDLNILMAQSKEVRLSQSNFNVGIEGPYLKHQTKKSLKNRIKRRIHQIKGLIYLIWKN